MDPMLNPQPVVCALCDLLVGWSAEPVRDFVCIPCLDRRGAIHSNDEKKKQTECARGN